MCYIIVEVIQMSNLHIEIGERITEQRKLKKMSQTEFAAALNKSLRTVQKYESGEIDISISTLQEISEVLEVPLSYFIGYDSTHMKIDCLSDILAFLFKLDRKNEIDFKIEVKKATDIHNWKCSIMINGNDEKHEVNYPLVQILKEFQKNRNSAEIYWMSYQDFDEWEENMLNRYSNCFLTDKEIEYLNTEERLKKFLELDRERVAEIAAQQNNGDDEQ